MKTITIGKLLSFPKTENFEVPPELRSTVITLNNAGTPVVRSQEKRLGRVLAAKTSLSDGQVSWLVHLATYLLTGIRLELVSDTNPDAWVQVYADGRHASSCLTPSPGNLVRYDPNNPRDTPLKTRAVKIYAAGQYLTSAPEPYRSQKLALAVLRSKEGAVLARAVVNAKTKEYVSVYGDKLLVHVLAAHGYERNHEALLGCVLRTVRVKPATPVPDSDFWLCPHLDGCSDVRAITFGGENFFEVTDASTHADPAICTYGCLGKIEYNGEWKHV